jgi:hypothetical protein
MALYDTRFGLQQSVVDYLNQGLPSISGIFQPSGPSIPTPLVEAPTIEDVITEEGIASLYPQVAASGGGDGFNPYDIRPGDSSIRTPDQYSPYAYRQALEKSYVGDPNGYGYRTNTEAQKMMDNYPDYYESKPLTGIEQLLSKIPTPLGLIKKGIDALGDKLPVNRTAIFQNELLGQGIKLDNIGRIVTDNYNTPEGIMAGYNPVSGGLLNMLTGGAYGEPTTYGLEKSVAERQSNIRDTLQDKYGLSEQQINDVLSEIEETGTYTGDLGFNQIMGKTTNLFKNLSDLGKFDLINKNASKKLNLIFEQKQEEERQKKQAEIDAINERKKMEADAAKQRQLQIEAASKTQDISRREAAKQQAAIERDQQRDRDRGGAGSGGGGESASGAGSGGGYNQGNFCFDPNTPIQMADGSEKKIKDIQLGDDTKGGEVTGVFQFKAADEIHDYKGVTVAGSHYVKEDDKFIMVKDSPLSVKIDKIPVVYSLDTTGRRIFINNIEFADYNGDGIAKGFLENAGVDLAGFDKEVLRQVEHRLI